ncbi:MAG: hypothetical protein R6V28_13855 [Nitriliruptoraceae bacterium]
MTIDDVLERILGNSVLINTGCRVQDTVGTAIGDGTLIGTSAH